MYKYCAKTSHLWNVQKLNTQNGVNNIAGQSETRFVRRQSSQSDLSTQNTTVTLQVDLVVFHLQFYLSFL